MALVRSLEQQVGISLRDSAVGKSAKLGDFRVMEYPQGKPAAPGEPAVAFVSVPSSGDNVAVEPNQIGEFPPVYADPGETVQVGVVFPATRPGTKVRIVAEDGGALEGADGQPAQVVELDAARSFSLPFQLGSVAGSYRLTIATTEGEPKRLHLHAGPAMR